MSNCTDPHHHVRNPRAFIAAVEESCAKLGLNLTVPRRAVLELIADSDKPLKAYDLLERMRAGNDSAAPPTVYRALDFLTEHGFVHRLESINAYIACHHPGGQAHATPFLICDHCGNAQELEQPAWIHDLESDAQTAGFKVRDRVIELHGLCRECCGTAQ